ncbi:non-ribosomal peptide synthetase [Micromonospora sp. DT48]|uniref:non-ribosomal peptide synthetase n=1 Tax=unclassified Micromonospora TaxID=2617518 RepID=UPI0012BB9439|nr:non-ribosomal peptide synthetase [Micromonospora sp. CP22]MTK01205.1 amino acid adenylation domain-containing protein [Micromonospora sp. CP22]
MTQDFDERLARLTPEQRARFEQLLAEQDQSVSFPLSVLQEGMWFLEQLQPGNPAYIGVSAVEIAGHRLDVGVLERAFEQVARVHEVTRTTFTVQDGRPVQVVSAPAKVSIPEIDMPGADDRAVAERAWQAVAAEGFDIQVSPPLRFAVIHTSPQRSVLAAAAHHLIFDRQAFGILLGILSDAYLALLDGKPAEVAAPRIQYGDFAAWQQQQRAGGAWAKELAYWRRELQGAPASLDLPVDRPRPLVQGMRGEQVPVTLSAQLMEGIATRARETGATPYMVLLTAFMIVLRGWSGQEDLVVGSPASSRDRPELGDLLGYFINVLPIRAGIRHDDSVRTVIGDVRRACLGAYEYHDVPFDLVVADLNIARDLSRPPVFQASFTYGREPVPGNGFGGQLRRLETPSEGSRFDLEIQAFHHDAELEGWLEYDRDLFDRATMERLVRHFRNVCAEIVADIDRPVGEIDLIDAQERHQLVAEFNSTDTAWPERPRWVDECFADRVVDQPGQPAVVFGTEQLTYAQLDERSNRLAHALIAAGVGRDRIVALALPRSIDLVVAVLAVIKAGGAYLPLDLDYPSARIAGIVDGARPVVLLTQSAQASRLTDLDVPVWALDTEVDRLAAMPTARPEVTHTPDDAAYVIYTSGSTGQPKGVINTHRGLSNRLWWMQQAMPIGTSDRVMQKTPYTFDVSVWEFLWPLMTGAAIVVAAPDGHRDPEYLASEIRRTGVTTLHFVPSMLRAFLDSVGEVPASVRRVVCSGEALSASLRDRVLDSSDADLYNLYGPTEAAIDVTWWDCRREPRTPVVPIGRPIANTQVHLLDEQGRLVPLGARGEICLGGDNLARGYLGRPDLTAERFVENTVDPARSPRLYRTGDLGRRRADGVIEYLGRLDDQVKLRGQRIELGEIESVALRHPAVSAAVVVMREVRPGDERLIAYLVAAAGADADTEAVRDHLRTHLPDYMVPAHTVWLDAIPLNRSGKADRKALPDPVLTREPGRDYVPPADDLEERIAALWVDVLGVDQVGRDDNFFDLGGHSLLLTKLRDRLAADLGHEVSLVDLFQNPTVASLARLLAGGGDDAPVAVADRAVDRAAKRRGSLASRRASAARRSAASSTREGS